MLDLRKANNVVALVGYIVEALEPYYKNRLYEVASCSLSLLLVAFAAEYSQHTESQWRSSA